jgi:hypothetical protein
MRVQPSPTLMTFLTGSLVDWQGRAEPGKASRTDHEAAPQSPFASSPDSGQKLITFPRLRVRARARAGGPKSGGWLARPRDMSKPWFR